MKTKVKHAVEIILTAVLTVFLALKVGVLLDPEWSGDGFDVVNAFHSLEDNSLDVIVYGSSHAWKGCDTRVMREKYNLAAYNYGCNWQAINTSLLFLEDSLRTQSPKVVCVETYHVNFVIQDVQLDGQIYYTKAISDFPGKREFLKKVFGKHVGRYVTYVFPLMMFHENWKNMYSENWRNPGYERFVTSTGFCESGFGQPYKKESFKTFGKAPINEEAIEILNRIVKVCAEKDIKLIFFTCPFIGENYYSCALEEYAKKNGCMYVDLFQHMDEMQFDPETDMNDGAHLCNSGAAKVADYLGGFILQNYGELFGSQPQDV